MSLFKLEDTTINQTGAIENKTDRVFKVCRPVQSLADALGKFKQNTDLHFVTAGAWALHDMVSYCADQIGPAELIGYTWSLTQPAADKLVKLLLDRKIKSMKFVIDGKMSKWSRGAIQFLQHHAQDIRITGIHAKGFILKNSEWKISVVSSANFSNNPRIEAGVLSTSGSVYNFNSKWLNELLLKGDPFKEDKMDLSGDLIKEPENFDKVLIVVRGIPGSGKSTFAVNAISDGVVIENDQYFNINGHYEWSVAEMRHAVGYSINRVREEMESGTNKIVIANVFKKLEDTKPFLELAHFFKYKIFQVITENINNTKNIHDIKEKSIENKKKGFEICL